MEHRRAIAGAKANQRHRFDAKSRGDNLADLAVSDRMTGIIEHFQVQKIGVQMPTRAGVAFAQRTGQFSDAISRINLRAPGGFDGAAGGIQEETFVADGFADADSFFDGTTLEIK